MTVIFMDMKNFLVTKYIFVGNVLKDYLKDYLHP